MKCPFCGSELEQGAGFCPACGTIISLDNDFVSPYRPSETPDAPPAQPEPPTQPEIADAPETPDVPETPEAPEAPETPDVPEAPEAPEAPDALHGMPKYVSPTFEAYEPAQPDSGSTPYDPETDDDDPFRELHPDLDETPPPVVIPAEAQISDTQPVAIEGSIPVYEPTEETDEPEEDADELEDMYVTDGKGKKSRVVAILVVLALLAGGVFAWYYVKKYNPFFETTNSDTQTSSQIASTTEPTSETADDTTDDTTDESDTDPDATDESDTDESVTDESVTDDTDVTDDTASTDLTDDENEITAPDDTTETPTTTATTRPTTTAPTTTTRPTTTRPTTTRPTTTRPTTTRPTTTRPTTRQTTAAPTTQPANTLQRPTSTFAAKTMYVNTNGVALRYAPRADSANRVSLSVGADVRVTAEENGFCYVYSNRYGVSGWVKKSYLGSSRPVAQTEQTVSGTVAPDVAYDGGTKTVNTGGTSLNLRKGPGTEYDIIRAVGDGYPVAVKGKSSTVAGWVYVTDITRGVSGWVSSAYLN